MAFTDLVLWLTVPLALALIWWPHLRKHQVPSGPVDTAPGDIAGLTRDLSFTTSHNALSAASVAFSVRQLSARVQSQLKAAEQVVSNAEVMIATEQQTAQLSQQALAAARACWLNWACLLYTSPSPRDRG